jgi:hypothetical protein
MSQTVGSRVPRLVALGAMIGVAAILAITALVLAQESPGAGTIPPYPDAKRFCGGHVTGAPTSGVGGPHIEWTAYYSLDAPDTVVAWYERRLASGLHRREGGHDIWRVPSDQPTAVLNVSAPGDAGPLTGCTDHPPATARTVIVMSTMSRPQAQATTPRQPKALRRSFPAAGITRFVLRAEDADKATVEHGAPGSAIEVSGIPTGGAAGYHSSDPNWRETPAAEWGLDFVSVQRGPILVVSTKNEMRYIHHHYAFASVSVRVPPGVEVVKEPRTLTGEGAPDLH